MAQQDDIKILDDGTVMFLMDVPKFEEYEPGQWQISAYETEKKYIPDPDATRAVRLDREHRDSA